MEDEEAALPLRGRSPSPSGSLKGSSEDRVRILYQNKMWKDDVDAFSGCCVVLTLVLFAVIPGFALMVAAMRGMYPLWALSLLSASVACAFWYLMIHGLVWRYRLAYSRAVVLLLIALTIVWMLGAVLGGFLCRSAYRDWEGAESLHRFTGHSVSLKEARALQVSYSPPYSAFELAVDVTVAPEYATSYTSSSSVPYCLIPIFETGQKMEKSGVFAFLGCENAACSDCAAHKQDSFAVAVQRSPYLRNKEQAMAAFREAASLMEAKYAVSSANPDFFLTLHSSLQDERTAYHHFLRVFLANVLGWWLSYVAVAIFFVVALTRKPRISPL